jgi:quercetin dioxygenase-like cupin family protein
MRIFRGGTVAMRPADANSFVGPAFTSLAASDELGTPVHVYRVEFRPGARTNWHSHSGPQWLFVVEGTVRAQPWGEAAIDVEAGDIVNIPPGEKHWHGASPGSRAVHIAVNVNVTTTWLEPVTDEQYGV